MKILDKQNNNEKVKYMEKIIYGKLKENYNEN